MSTVSTSYNRWEPSVLIILRASSIAHFPIKHGLSRLLLLVLPIIDIKLVLNIINILFILIPFHSRTSFRNQKRQKKEKISFLFRSGISSNKIRADTSETLVTSLALRTVL